MENKTQTDVHLPGQTSIILNSKELDVIETALLNLGRSLKVVPDNFEQCEAISNAYRKLAQARQAGCCDAVRLFGM
jgi:hypothetical protein